MHFFLSGTQTTDLSWALKFLSAVLLTDSLGLQSDDVAAIIQILSIKCVECLLALFITA